jgi:hypothetical protein
VFALPVGVVAENFLDTEIISRRAQARLQRWLAIGAWKFGRSWLGLGHDAPPVCPATKLGSRFYCTAIVEGSRE